jgi:hypothetical protein
VVSLCFALASQLSGFVNTQKVRTTEIKFVGLKVLEGKKGTFLIFKMMHDGKCLTPAAIGKVNI